MTEDEAPNPMEDLNQEQIQNLQDTIEDFMRNLGKFAIRNDIRDQYDGLLMMAFETVVQESVAEEEAVVAFAENFLEYCENLEEEGMIQVADSEDELRQRYEDAKDSLKEMEGRK